MNEPVTLNSMIFVDALLVSITRVSRVSLFFKASSIWVMPICPMPFFPKSAAIHLRIERPPGFRVQLVRMRLVAMVVPEVGCVHAGKGYISKCHGIFACVIEGLLRPKKSHKSIVEPAGESSRLSFT